MEIRDQTGRSVEIPRRPRRIVSLCPSTTETLFALGAGDAVAGRTRYCCHPRDRVGSLASVGGTKAVDLEALARLEPDLVVAVKEENHEPQVREIAVRWPTLVLDPVDVASALDGLRLLGRALFDDARGAALADDIARRFAGLPRLEGLRVLYLIWRKPFMAVGAGTYLDDVLRTLGFVNVASSLDGRYPELDADRVEALTPEILLASSEPFPFESKHLAELRALAPGARVAFVDGELFSWHGARMLEAADYFAGLVARLGGPEG